jgi:hypothetical protein
VFERGDAADRVDQILRRAEDHKRVFAGASGFAR